MNNSLLGVREFVDPIYGQNSRIVTADGQSVCWVIDPGLPPASENILSFLSEKGLAPEALILTHAHADHIAGLPVLLERFADLPVYLAEIEWPFLADPTQNLSAMGGMDLRVSVVNLLDLSPGMTLELGRTRWQVFDTSGHSPGGRTLYCEAESIALVGDALFAGSIGRVDFPHSDGARLLTNIREQLFTLPGQTRICSGHGPDTTVEVERSTNPFFEH